MLADVVFDLPLDHPFSYLVPDSLTRDARPARERAARRPRHARRRGRRAPTTAIDHGPAAHRARSSSPRRSSPRAASTSAAGSPTRASPRGARRSWLSCRRRRARSARKSSPRPSSRPGGGAAPVAELWMDAAREERLASALGDAPGGALVIAPDTDSAARWARRLDAARLDSGAGPAERRAAWFAAARRARPRRGRHARGAPRAAASAGHARAARRAGPRPQASGAAAASLARHPAPPRGARRQPPHHARGQRRRSRVWQKAVAGAVARVAGGTCALARGDRRRHARHPPQPSADAAADARHREHVARRQERGADRGPIRRRHRLQRLRRRPPLSRLRRGASADGATAARWRAGSCARSDALPERCPGCGGHRLQPFGWDAERVEASVRRRFPRLTVSRTDPRRPGADRHPRPPARVAAAPVGRRRLRLVRRLPARAGLPRRRARLPAALVGGRGRRRGRAAHRPDPSSGPLRGRRRARPGSRRLLPDRSSSSAPSSATRPSGASATSRRAARRRPAPRR